MECTPDGRCSCCGDAVATTGRCLRCSSRIAMCAGCGVILSCGCGRQVTEHQCRALVPVSVIVTIPEGSATIDLGRVPIYPADFSEFQNSRRPKT